MSRPKRSSAPDIDGPDSPFRDRGYIDEDRTVPPRVLYQREHRKYTDIWFGVAFVAAYIAFLGCGITIVVQSRPRYNLLENDIRQVASYYKEDIEQCCASARSKGGPPSNFDLCFEDIEDGNDRRRRYLAETGDSKFEGDEGIFDAFLEAPEIPAVMGVSTVAIGIIWVVLLRYCAKPMVILSQLVKIGLVIYLGVLQPVLSAQILCWGIAAGLIVYCIWARKEILFAGDIISYSCVSFKENPIMFVAIIFLKVLFAGNAILYVYFFSKSFDVAEVKQKTDCDPSGVCTTRCVFEYTKYLYYATGYMAFAYLWTLFVFHKMRLSVIATIVGSWHFHPEEKAGVCTALRNTFTTSFGTLSISALISTIAERINQRAQQRGWQTWINPVSCILAPLYILLCILGASLTMIIKMLTKFAVILHVFTGLPFIGSAKKVLQIMLRHFKGGFVTELTSKSVLNMGAYFFSIGITILSWVWLNDKFDADSLPSGDKPIFIIIGFILMGLIVLRIPIISIFLLTVLSRFLTNLEYQHYWLPPLAALFIGCIAMLFFLFISEIFLDTIDTLFLCFAIDKDNGVTKDPELDKLVKSVPGYIEDSSPSGAAAKAVTTGGAAVATAVSIGAAVDDSNTNRSNRSRRVVTTTRIVKTSSSQQEDTRPNQPRHQDDDIERAIRASLRDQHPHEIVTATPEVMPVALAHHESAYDDSHDDDIERAVRASLADQRQQFPQEDNSSEFEASLASSQESSDDSPSPPSRNLSRKGDDDGLQPLAIPCSPRSPRDKYARKHRQTEIALADAYPATCNDFAQVNDQMQQDDIIVQAYPVRTTSYVSRTTGPRRQQPEVVEDAQPVSRSRVVKTTTIVRRSAGPSTSQASHEDGGATISHPPASSSKRSTVKRFDKYGNIVNESINGTTRKSVTTVMRVGNNNDAVEVSLDK